MQITTTSEGVYWWNTSLYYHSTQCRVDVVVMPLPSTPHQAILQCMISPQRRHHAKTRDAFSSQLSASLISHIFPRAFQLSVYVRTRSWNCRITCNHDQRSRITCNLINGRLSPVTRSTDYCHIQFLYPTSSCERAVLCTVFG